MPVAHRRAPCLLALDFKTEGLVLPYLSHFLSYYSSHQPTNLNCSRVFVQTFSSWKLFTSGCCFIIIRVKSLLSLTLS